METVWRKIRAAEKRAAAATMRDRKLGRSRAGGTVTRGQVINNRTTQRRAEQSQSATGTLNLAKTAYTLPSLTYLSD